jgi:copper homeostasis protein (lipoprotein)
MMKYVIGISLVFLTFISCGKSKENGPTGKQKDSVLTQQDTAWKDSDENLEYYSYEGVLPDENGKAAQTTLQIAKDYQTFKLIEKPLFNKPQRTKDSMTSVEIVIEGNLNTERGYENDPDATVYILNWDKPENQQRVFVRSTGNNTDIFEIEVDRKRKLPKDKRVLSLKE